MKVSLDLKVNSYFVPNLFVGTWAEVFRMTSTENDCCNVGDRIMAIFTNRDTKRVYVIIDAEDSSGSGGSKHNVHVLEESLKENTWYKIELTWGNAIDDTVMLHISYCTTSKHQLM